MEIKEFIQETITQITEGVAKINDSQSSYIALKDMRGENIVFHKKGNAINSVVMVDFDIAVTVSQKNEKTKGIGASLKVASFGFDTDFSKGDLNENQQVSRIRFSLPLVINDENKI